MAVKIRLKRLGKKNCPYYKIVVSNDYRSRNGMSIENIGFYDPIKKLSEVDIEKSIKWLKNGAIPTDKARSIMSKKGVFLKKHLQIGVEKGAISQDIANTKFLDWKKSNEGKVYY